MRNLQTLAESTTRISGALKAAHPEVDWRGIRGFRSVLVHDYLGVDYEVVWRIVVRELPPLKENVVRMLEELGGPPEET